jgi:hypothetical protein
MARFVYVTADSDPARAEIAIEAPSLFQAALNYCARCAAPSMGEKPLPLPTNDTVLTVRDGERVYRVTRGRAMEWANQKAQEIGARSRSRDLTKRR